jgi:hypothetical protein
MLDRPEIQRKWCQGVIENPVERIQQRDGKFQMWGYIAEAEKYLRVVTLEDGETIDNAFFDRGYLRRKTNR